MNIFKTNAFKILFLCSTLLLSGTSRASATFEMECDNYCSFREFNHNCHGVFFNVVTKKSTTKLYTRWSTLLNGCMENEPVDIFTPTFHFASARKIRRTCSCADLPVLPPPPKRDEPLKPETAQELIQLRDQISSWVPCAPDPFSVQIPTNPNQNFLPSDTDTCQHMKAQGKKSYGYLGGCRNDPQGQSNCNYYGNTNSYGGPLCLAGNTDWCNDMLAAQDPLTGAWYRNAYNRRIFRSNAGQPLYSRDEFMGDLMYFAKTKDKVAAEKWMRFISSNPKKDSSVIPSMKVFSICPPLPAVQPPDISDSEWASMQPDDRCEMRPDSWGNMYRTYRTIGFSDSDLKSINSEMFANMIFGVAVADSIANISVKTVPRYTYQMGDQADNLLLLIGGLGITNNILVNDAAYALDSRTGFDSPFYHWVSEGGQATEYGAYLIKKYCSPIAPTYGTLPNGNQSEPAASFYDFAVHFYGGVDKGWGAVDAPTGHDCVGWIDLYLNRKSGQI